MSTNYKISQLRDLFNDWENGLDQAVTLIPLFPIEVINEYWSMGWMQNPGNPDDRWKSDWIRAILMAFSTEGSLPYDAKFLDRSRHQQDYTGGYTDEINHLTLTTEWYHLSDQLLHDIIKNLGVTQLEFRSALLFEKYLKKPVEVAQIKVYITKDWNVKTTRIKDANLAKTISENIPKSIEIFELHVDDNYDINFSENSLLNFKNLKVFTFESNCKQGIFNFSNNILLEEVNVKLKNESDTLNIKGLNNCLQLKKIHIIPEANCIVNLEPIEFSKFSKLADFSISGTSYFSDIKGVINNELILDKYWYKDGRGVEGVKNIAIELNPNGDFEYSEIKLNSVHDLESIIVKGEAYNVELKELPKLFEASIDLNGITKNISIDFSRELESRLQIKANKLKTLTLSNYKNNEFPDFIVNSVWDDIYDNDNDGKLIVKIDNSLLESLDGLEKIKCDSTLLLKSNHELKKLFKDSTIRCECIKRLVITNSTVTSLDGINQFPNLTELVLNDMNVLENINGLEALTQLKLVDLTNCSLLTSLEPLANLTTITELKLSGCTAIKPKPKRLNLTGMQVFDELNRHNKSKPKKRETASGVSISKIIDFFKAADADSINQGFMLLSLCNPEELNRLYNSVEYNERIGKLVFTYLPKSILEDENASRLISLLLLFEAPEESLAGQFRNKIEALFLNCDVEVKKAKISLGSENNIDFTPYINSIGKFSKFKNLKQIQIEEFSSFDFIDMAEVASIVDVHISNIRTILNFDTMAINKNLVKLTIQEQYYVGQSASNATHLIDVAFSSNFSSLEYLKLNLNCNSITGLEHLINCNDLRLIIHAALDKLTFNSSMKNLEYIYLKGNFCTIENIEQLQKLTKLDITQATLSEPKFLINLLANQDYILNKGILENTKLS